MIFGFRLKEKLESEKPGSAEKLPAIQKPLTDILKNFKDLQFFTGESMNPDGMIAILDYMVTFFSQQMANKFCYKFFFTNQ